MANRIIDPDAISYCSLSGETITSRRRKNTVCSLRSHNAQYPVDNVSTRLRLGPTLSSELKGSTLNGSIGSLSLVGDFDQLGKPPLDWPTPPRQRWNTSFHQLRFVVVIFGGLSLGLMLLLRFNITVAILNMVNQTAIYMKENPDKTMEDFLDEGYSPGGEFYWDNEIQYLVMSLYMIAYTLPQVPATSLGLKIGSRWTTPISLSICALANMLTPWAAYLGWRWVVALRMLNGIGATAVLPMLLSIIENWMSYDEISLGLTCAQILQSTLTTLNPLIVGYLSNIHWSYAFTVPGLVTLVFCALWPLVVTDKPDENWLISQTELDLICGCHPNLAPPTNHDCGDANCCDKDSAQADGGHNNKVDWWRVFSVPSFYAYLCLWCCYCSSYSCFNFILPSYMRQFLKITVVDNGFYCALIQTGCIVSVIWPHPILRFLQGPTFNLSLTAARRLVHLVICLVVASTWISVGFLHQTQLLLLFLNRCAQGSNDIVVTASIMSNYSRAGLSSLVFSMVNTVGNLSVVAFSSVVGYVLDAEGASRSCWSYIYFGLGLSQLLMWVLFALFVHSETIEFGEVNQKRKKQFDVELAKPKQTLNEKRS